jgi:hypothetical protein
VCEPLPDCHKLWIPFLHGIQLFNTRKLSPIFTSPNESEVPPVFVDRLGLKGWTSHCGGQDNKVEHSVMLQRINTCDENGMKCCLRS